MSRSSLAVALGVLTSGLPSPTLASDRSTAPVLAEVTDPATALYEVYGLGADNSHILLNDLDGELTAEIRADYCDPANPPTICLGPRRCYSLAPCAGASGCFSSSTTVTCDLAEQEAGEDHPFVDHPDDWDRIRVDVPLASSDTLALDELELNFDYGANQDDSALDSLTGSYVFLDETFVPARQIPPGGSLSLDDRVRQRREDAAMAVTVSAFSSFEELPWMVREAVYDIGQAGIVKYKPWDTSAQNGCDEFFTHFASQYSNNILFSCEDSSCSYFDRWTTDNAFGGISVDQFIDAGRAYKVIFNLDATGQRIGVAGIHACTDSDCSTWDTASSYTPKVGDFFIRKNAACGCVGAGNFHVMMVLGEFRDTSVGNQVGFDVDIVDKSTIVNARTRTFTHNSINTSVCCLFSGACLTSEFFYEFYFGEVDHEVDQDGAGPMTSGSRSKSPGPNFGLRATLIAIVD